MSKKFLSIFIILFIALVVLIIILNTSRQKTELKNKIDKLGNDTNQFFDPDTLKCLSRVRRDISLCDSELAENLQEDMAYCKDDYYFFMSIIDKEPNLCDLINGEDVQKVCKAIILKTKENIPNEFCQSREPTCEYLINNNFIIDEGFCDVLMKTNIGKQRCKAVIKKDESLCYEPGT